jgi:glucose/arabinose dehydrogenase
MRLTGFLLASVMTVAAASGAQAQQQGQPSAEASPPQGEGLTKLLDFKSSGGSMSFETVPQTGEATDNIRENLKRIKMPPGFTIDLYALVPDARSIAVGPQGVVTYVGTRKTRVWTVTDRDKNRVADEVKPLAPPISFKIPNAVCFSKDGFLFVVEQNRILTFPAGEFFYENPDVAVAVVVDQGQLIPTSEESFNHSGRVCRVGPDNKLYVALGQPYNVPAPAKMDLYNEWGLGGIIRMDRDGSNREVYAHGIRNSVGMDFNPKNGELWFTDNQVDGMGDDIPPGEINRITAPGQHFGFPWYGGGKVRTKEYKDSEPPADVVFPEVETVAHAADLGMTFYNKSMFPEEYRGGIFSAQHGSWNRTTPVGARLLFTSLKPDGSADRNEVLAEGWLDESTGEYLGRPVDVAVLQDGSLLVSDDLAGALYRISYKKP